MWSTFFINQINHWCLILKSIRFAMFLVFVFAIMLTSLGVSSIFWCQLLRISFLFTIFGLIVVWKFSDAHRSPFLWGCIVSGLIFANFCWNSQENSPLSMSVWLGPFAESIHPYMFDNSAGNSNSARFLPNQTKKIMYTIDALRTIVGFVVLVMGGFASKCFVQKMEDY